MYFYYFTIKQYRQNYQQVSGATACLQPLQNTLKSPIVPLISTLKTLKTKHTIFMKQATVNSKCTVAKPTAQGKQIIWSLGLAYECTQL